MAKSSPKLRATKPKSVWNKPVTVNLKDLFKALAKGFGHTVSGKWEELASDAVESLSAIGLATEPGELASLLIRRSLANALFEIVDESASQLDVTKNSAQMAEQLNYEISYRDIDIDGKFLDRPSNLPLLNDLQVLLGKWLEANGISVANANAIARRLPSYFAYALNKEWRRNAKSYRPLLEAVDTPFSKAGNREWAWSEYSALLQRRVQEGVFDEPFSLAQVYVPLNAYYLEDKTRKELPREMVGASRRRIVISLRSELEQWLRKPKREDAIRVVSGGPGSGKSSFARIFAAELSKDAGLKVLYVPLHLIDPARDLVEEVGRFAKDEGMLLQNPLDPESPEPSLLIIFDGLDELASQGKAAVETARAFVGEVEKTIEKRNLQGVRLHVLLSGRELVVQENESEFRRERQILTLLPYFVPGPSEKGQHRSQDGEEYHDPDGILAKDLRNQWWINYGKLTGEDYDGLPKDLRRNDLDEITAQPLLNYLVAFSYARGKLDFTKGVNLNSVYADLVDAVHERAYEKHRRFGPVRHMDSGDFLRVLEEIGLAAWHGDGRTTSVREIEEHCRTSGLGSLLDVFQERAKAGVTRLLAAFFFRQYGQRPSGDPTFVFTHKSFGEYLTARRIVRAIDRVVRELERRVGSPDEGWGEREALKHWAQVCGPSAMSRYLHVFLLNEMKLHSVDELLRWQARLEKLFGYMLSHGMPMEQLQFVSFKEALFQSRNAEEALLVALNACALCTGHVSEVVWPTPTAFGEWFKRIQGQRVGAESVLAADCLSFLNLGYQTVHIGDFLGANFQSSLLLSVHAEIAVFNQGTFLGANLSGADLIRADFASANLRGASLEGAQLLDAVFESADLRGANLKGANLRGATFKGAILEGVNFEGANLEGINLEGVNLAGVNLEGARIDIAGSLRPGGSWVEDQ